jgi:GT2 family glycosyltransferase
VAVPSSSGEPLDATVVICAYTLDRWDELTEAVASVERQTRRPRQTILVIDNNAEMLRRAQRAFTGITVVENRHGVGASGGRNTGYDLSEASILVFLDDDAFAAPTWLEELLSAFDDPAVLGTGGALEPVWRGGRPAWFTDEFNWIVGCTYTGMPTVRAEIRNPICANMSVRRDVFERAGGFEHALSRLDSGGLVTGTAEETEFCIRARQRTPGGYWLYVPEARVQHVVPPSRSTFAYFRGRCRLEGASKAILTELTGTEDGLSSERDYVRSTLPRAVLRELRAAARGDRDGLRRVGAIVAGAAYTGIAYARVRAEIMAGRRPRPVASTDPA